MWRPATRVAFRFAFAWFVLTNLPFPVGSLPWTWGSASYYRVGWGLLVRLIAVHVIHAQGSMSPAMAQSSDRMFDWLLAGTLLLASAVVALVWSIVDRRRVEYGMLHEGLRVYLRFALASVLLGYGLVKIFPAQFNFPGDDWLLEPYGRSSPMRLLWAFMGYSRTYTTFGGLAEIIPGLLLFWRRTVTLGALLAVAVLTNVFVLNISYDVPAKLWSAELLVVAMFLVVPDARRLASFFLLQRPTQPVAAPPPPRRRWMRVGARVATALLAVMACVEGLRTLHNFWSVKPRPALYGIYEVDTFERNGELLPPLLTDSRRWRRMVVNRWGSVIVDYMDETQQSFKVDEDAPKPSGLLTNPHERDARFELSFARGEGDVLTVEGTWRGDHVRVVTHRVDDATFLLVSRGFHWVSEYPFQR